MSNLARIRVFYPKASGSICLHTSLAWDDDVEASAVGDDGTRWEFTVPTNDPYFYFKPCLRDGGNLHWAVGSNYLAIAAAAETRDVYPHFFDGTSGDITHPLDVPVNAGGTPAPPGGPGDYGHKIRVYQPPGYDENTLKRYPVLYMHDGTNLFFPDEAFMGQTWKVQQTMDTLDAMNVMNKCIVVGIWAGDRMNEYTKAGYEGYGRFVVESLKPFVDGGFRTLGDAANTAVLGSSLGGVVSFYLAWQWPGTFGQAACMSSTFGGHLPDGSLVDDLCDRARVEDRRPVRFYLDSGWPDDNYENTQTMRDILAQRGWEPGKDLAYYAFPGATHDEKHWALRSHIPFQFFFGKPPPFVAG